MKKWKLKLSLPFTGWDKDSILINMGDTQYKTNNPNSACLYLTDLPSDYPDIFELIPDQTDEEFLAGWLDKEIRPILSEGDFNFKFKLACILIEHGFDVNKLRSES